MRDSARRWFIAKTAKYFAVMLNSFEFSWVWEIVKSWLAYKNKVFELSNHISRLTQLNKLVQASFSCFQEF